MVEKPVSLSSEHITTLLSANQKFPTNSELRVLTFFANAGKACKLPEATSWLEEQKIYIGASTLHMAVDALTEKRLVAATPFRERSKRAGPPHIFYEITDHGREAIALSIKMTKYFSRQ